MEAGTVRPVAGVPDVLAADIAHPEYHEPTSLVSASALGGTSHWWGGRALPLDAADFDGWPISFEAMTPWYIAAAKFLGVPVFEAGQVRRAFASLSDFSAAHDEFWCPQTDMSKRWSSRLKAANRLSVFLRARVLGLIERDGAVEALRVRVRGEVREVRARHFVLACGGLGVLRLLLLAQRDNAALFGGANGPLGRGYMGHLTGSIANLAIDEPVLSEDFAVRNVSGGAIARRQLRPRDAFIRETGMINIAFWLDDAPKEDARHGSAVASAKYLAARALNAMSSPTRARGKGDSVKPHLANVARAPVSAALGLGKAGVLLLRKAATGRLQHAQRLLPVAEGEWCMMYHAEQRSHPENRIGLSQANVDSEALPRLKIDFTFSSADAEAVVRMHEALDRDLRNARAGQLVWRGGRDESLDIVLRSARDGCHQLGGAAMSASSSTGVVNEDCRVHGLSNLWIASSCVFPTGGQANPTMTIVALAQRLAQKLSSFDRA